MADNNGEGSLGKAVRKEPTVRSDNAFAAGTRTDLSLTIRAATTSQNGGKPNGWFGPFTPPQPMAPQDDQSGVVGRAFDYPTGYNLNQRPRAYESTSFSDLINMSWACDVMRLVIETRKDQLSGLDWIIRPKASYGEDARRVKATADQQNRIVNILDFMASPDKEMSFDDWTREFMEDHFVIDAPTVYRRPDRGGKLYALELMAGETIIPLLSNTGRRPLAPDPAYEQILHGIVAANYSSDQMYYLPRNRSTRGVYGRSPVEQVLITANIAVRRALFQLEYYTKGSQPDAFLSVPDTWTLDQTAAFQKHLDSLRSKRRAVRVVPGGFKYQATKEAHLKDEYDDYLNRLICFAFNVTPNALIKMINRSTSESSHNQALEEGNGPTMKWYAGIWSRIIANDFASPDLEFAYVDDRAIDPKEQMEVDVGYAKAGIYTIDEIRDSRGKDSLGGAAAVPMALTPTGYVTIGATVPTDLGGDLDVEAEAKRAADAQAQAMAAKQALAAPTDGSTTGSDTAAPSNDNAPAKPKLKDKSVAKLAKLHKKGWRYNLQASAKRSTIVSAKAAITAKATKLLADARKAAIKHVVDMTKAAPLGKAEGDDEAERIAASADFDVVALIAKIIESETELVALEAGHEALVRFGLGGDKGLFNQVNESAVEYARERAAYLVGMRWTSEGELIDNPRAGYSITEATRGALRDLITTFLDDASPMPDLADAIENSFAFSEDRARMIAATEVGNANSAGALAGYKAAASTGLKVLKVWSVTDDSCCDDCESNEEDGPIPLDDAFSSGDDAPLAHPNCRCVLLSAVEEGEGEGEGGEADESDA